MALTRAALREMGVTEKEIIDNIMEAHGAGIEAAKEKAKDSAQKTIDDLQAKVDGKQTDGDGKDYKALFEAELEAHNKTKESHEAEKTAELTDKEVSELLKASGMNEKVIPKALKMYDRTTIQRDKDGKIKNSDKVVESFKGEWDGFFGEVKTAGADVADPPASQTKTPPAHTGMNAFIRGVATE